MADINTLIIVTTSTRLFEMLKQAADGDDPQLVMLDFIASCLMKDEGDIHD